MDVFDLPVHPAAAIFPMMSDEELDELGADIATNGLRYPLVVKDGQLIDGRNRREACQRVNLVPRVEELNGADPIAYILSANVARRHMTKGQRAMAVAKLYPEPQKGGRGKKASIPEGFSQGKVSEARTILAWLPQIADAVLAGTTPLAEAYQEALRVKEQADAEPKRLERLRDRAPQLAEFVAEGRMSLAEAESAYATRVSEERRERQAIRDVLEGLDRHLDFFADGPRRDRVVEVLRTDAEASQLRALLRQWIRNLTETEAMLRVQRRPRRSNAC